MLGAIKEKFIEAKVRCGDDTGLSVLRSNGFNVSEIDIDAARRRRDELMQQGPSGAPGRRGFNTLPNNT
ncbi:MAG: hypothetical protein M1120_00345 [Patescibacteria group bacterium]|nr:hypothetical protein [Patescibacteria group bacterium]